MNVQLDQSLKDPYIQITRRPMPETKPFECFTDKEIDLEIQFLWIDTSTMVDSIKFQLNNKTRNIYSLDKLIPCGPEEHDGVLYKEVFLLHLLRNSSKEPLLEKAYDEELGNLGMPPREGVLFLFKVMDESKNVRSKDGAAILNDPPKND
jgi:hypothetical protein